MGLLNKNLKQGEKVRIKNHADEKLIGHVCSIIGKGPSITSVAGLIDQYIISFDSRPIGFHWQAILVSELTIEQYKNKE